MKFKAFYNAFISFFVAYIILIRSQMLQCSDAVTYHLNTTEHLLFAIIICLHIAIYLQVFKLRIAKYAIELLLIIFIFNAIGIINEWFQNYMTGKALFVLDPDDLKDIKVNLAGTFLYAFFVLYKNTRVVFLAKE